MSKLLTKSVFPLLFLAFILVLFAIYLPAGVRGQVTPDTEFSGYAWSSNIGWISLNCEQPSWGGSDPTNTCADSGGYDYSVAIDFTTGDFSGHAWSSNIGWISFNRADTGNPPSADPGNGSGPIAKLVTPASNCASGKEVSGWMRALSNGDGWDGWIRMSGTATDGTTHYGVCLNSDNKALGGTNGTSDSGWAWGDQVVGWVEFNPAQNAVAKKSNIIEIPPM